METKTQIVNTKIKLQIFCLSTIFVFIAFILNITSDSSMYQLDLDTVSVLQQNGTNGLATFMNIISNIFNPILCAGYVLLIYLITSRKL
jgi:hypothetical protein